MLIYLKHALRRLCVKWWILTGRYKPFGTNCIISKDGRIYKADYAKPCSFRSNTFYGDILGKVYPHLAGGFNSKVDER